MTFPSVVRIDGVVRDYAWGSTSAIQELLGRPIDGRPAAELWFGAHPDDPARVVELGTTLDTVITADPQAALGPAVVATFGPRLPFLLKVLAAAKPLSIQVHPTVAQARDGFARHDPNYRDANHKPELLCALTPFEALCGFRPVAQTLHLLDALNCARLIPVAELLRRTDGLRLAFTALLRDADPETLAYAVADAARDLPDEWAGPRRAVKLAAADFPGDIGVVLALLLNYVRLVPGEAIYLGAGNVHAYLQGTGVEIMANSDNVLRCGLTPKHIDVDELLRITDFNELDDPRWPSSWPGFTVPVADFRLDVLGNGYELDNIYMPGRPLIVLCTAAEPDGGPTVNGLALAPGQAAFVSAETQALISGHGTVFVASVGELS